MQMAIVKDKWDPPSQSSPFRAYIYNNVGEEAAPFYQPGPEDDHTKWEEALRKRPGPGYVPVLVKGFWELGKRAQRQRDFLTMIQSRLHEINNCLTELLSKHDLNLSIKIADARRKHIILSKRCLALAAKTQILRNRGYAMDEAEEELKKKLTQLERSVFDPSINGRGEEIWARMLAIHEHSKRLQAELDRAGVSVTPAEDDIDEQTLKTAKKVRCLIYKLLESHTDSLRFWMTTTPRFSIFRRKWSPSRRTSKKRRALMETDYLVSAHLLFKSQVHPSLFIFEGHGSTGVLGDRTIVMHT
jgi:nuclear pore complex protein Nup54